ncbi:MAG: Methionine--tRNA ligase [Planctomycetes bacterium ADurb.Bin126]|nr:MAG: Methionine--tRNA ligase [Planctomycetes bacterium ADurb.Bin126]HQL75200.1 methionine--tRNA ligase subunit beta [Phycisphaerae bacterium]
MSEEQNVPPAPANPPAPDAAPASAAPPAAAPAPAAATKPEITYDDFVKLDLRVAKVLQAAPHPNADKLLCLTVDLGTEQRQVIAGLRAYYAPEALVGKQIIVVTNLAPRKMRGLESKGMLLAASHQAEGQLRDVVILMPDKEVPPGSPVS